MRLLLLLCLFLPVSLSAGDCDNAQVNTSDLELRQTNLELRQTNKHVDEEFLAWIKSQFDVDYLDICRDPAVCRRVFEKITPILDKPYDPHVLLNISRLVHMLDNDLVVKVKEPNVSADEQGLFDMPTVQQCQLIPLTDEEVQRNMKELDDLIKMLDD